jgi:nucleoside-diphosphate-sugar epimerase
MMMQHNIDIAVHSDGSSEYTLIHQDDINRLAPKFLAHASVPAEIFNFSGQEHVSIEEWVAYIESLTGLTANFKVTSDTLESVKTDNTKMCQAIGSAQVTWQDGIRAMVEKAGALKS